MMIEKTTIWAISWQTNSHMEAQDRLRSALASTLSEDGIGSQLNV